MPSSSNNPLKAAALIALIKSQVKKATGKGLEHMRIFLTSRTKETMSVPAPRKRVVTNAGDIYYRATTPATPGAPIRKLSGQARNRLVSQRLTETSFVIGDNAKSPKGFPYPKHHEIREGGSSGMHRFIAPTLRRWKSELIKILGRAFKTEF